MIEITVNLGSRSYPIVIGAGELRSIGPRLSRLGTGARVALVTKGWLPYRLRWIAKTTRLDRPWLIEFKGEGDFRTDSSRWVLREIEGGAEATLEWNPIVDQLVVRLLSPIARPLFRSNHVWAMRLGERQLKEYMASRDRKP